MYSRILLATDGSDAVEPAIEHAIELAAYCDATLYVVSVIDASAASGVPEAQTAPIQEIMEDAAQKAVEAAADRARNRGVAVETMVRNGSVHGEILQAAVDADVDLIVMGTHGRSGLDRLLLGSVADRVIRQASQPVLVKRATNESVQQ